MVCGICHESLVSQLRGDKELSVIAARLDKRINTYQKNKGPSLKIHQDILEEHSSDPPTVNKNSALKAIVLEIERQIVQEQLAEAKECLYGLAAVYTCPPYVVMAAIRAHEAMHCNQLQETFHSHLLLSQAKIDENRMEISEIHSKRGLDKTLHEIDKNFTTSIKQLKKAYSNFETKRGKKELFLKSLQSATGFGGAFEEILSEEDASTRANALFKHNLLEIVANMDA
ncbi:hypothetical protein Ciccas_000721 [Cichlidogyrus casuarinus]|uniref:Uncharacterized protein n=1 Tax=Cichlidogyrus casuarinus TaxID=1844966 RepID=A0ABD2QM29_9PLAT